MKTGDWSGNKSRTFLVSSSSLAGLHLLVDADGAAAVAVAACLPGLF